MWGGSIQALYPAQSKEQYSLENSRSTSKRFSAAISPKTRRTPTQKIAQNLKIAWRFCYTRKPFRELYPRMRTPEWGQIEAFYIGCQKRPRGLSRQLETLSQCPRSQRLYQTEGKNARGEPKKLSRRAIPGIWLKLAAVSGTLLRESLLRRPTFAARLASPAISASIVAWNLQITSPAQKEFHKLPAKDQAGVKDALLAMQEDSFPGSCSADTPVRVPAAYRPSARTRVSALHGPRPYNGFR